MCLCATDLYMKLHTELGRLWFERFFSIFQKFEEFFNLLDYILI